MAEQESYEEKFYGLMRQKNGVFKTTVAHRLDEINAAVNRLLPSDRPLQLMDVAISSGVSTLEWVESLRAAAIAHQMVAGDTSIQGFLVSIGRRVDVLVDRNGHAMHFDAFGLGVPNTAARVWQTPAFMVLNLASAAFLWTQPGLRRSFREEALPFKSWAPITCRPVTLVSPRLQELASVDIVEDDILANSDARFRRRFHVVRAANILNINYFDEATLTRMLVNLRSRLRLGGLLVVCRTREKGVNHGQVFRLEAERFISVERFGQGSEIETLVLGLR